MDFFLYAIQDDDQLRTELIDFISLYGMSGLREALRLYTSTSPDYICKTKTSVYRINIHDIYYLKICGHQIMIHTSNDIYQKYGVLHKELEFLAPHGFIKCCQSCIVALNKIKGIEDNTIILINNDRLHVSRTCMAKVLTSFNSFPSNFLF